MVSYVLDREWTDGFQGQVLVVNHGPQPIAGWHPFVVAVSFRVIKANIDAPEARIAA